MPKTVFIVVHQGFMARFLLRTDILPTLSAGGVRVVIMSPNHDEPYFREEFEAPNVELVPLRMRAEEDPTRSTMVRTTVRTLRNYALSGRRSPALLSKYEKSIHRLAQGNPRWFVRGLDFTIRQVVWRFGWARRAVLWAETMLAPVALHGDHFERYKPELVIAGSPGYFRPDGLVLREARQHGAATVGIVAGWDNPTSKGYRAATPTRTFVWSERMAGQMRAFQDYPRRRTEVHGVPHFDLYVREGAIPPRAEFIRSIGLDPEGKLIVYATSTPGAYDHNALICETIARAIDDGSLSAGSQLVIRLHPIYFAPGNRAPMDRFEGLRERYPFVFLDVPQIISERLRVDMAASDQKRIAGLFKHADVQVNVFSTTAVETCLSDTPTVLLEPTAHEGDPEAVHDGVRDELTVTRKWHEFAHLEPLTRDDAFLIAGSMEELVAHIATYLADPSLHREGRARVAARECGPTDGRTGYRIGSRLLELIDVVPPAPEGVVGSGSVS